MQMPQISTTVTDKFQIPIPPLKEQERIVSILDKFDMLTNSISEGLPKEIALRKKQYEYYREMLLTFPKTNT
jgi:type I restriction enzyme S subunit